MLYIFLTESSFFTPKYFSVVFRKIQEHSLTGTQHNYRNYEMNLLQHYYLTYEPYSDFSSCLNDIFIAKKTNSGSGFNIQITLY